MWCREDVQTSLPQANYNSASFYYDKAEELAKRVLRELPLGNWPGQSLLNVLEEVCGVKIFCLEFEPSGTAASTVSESFGAAILLNVNNVRWRRNFDLAHELFHLLTWKSFHGDGAGPITVDEQEEKFADCFASNLLMPTDPFRTAINSRIAGGKITFESLFDVSREFDVSIESLMWRLHFVYGRKKSDSERTKKEIEQAKTLMPLFQQDRNDQKPPALPARYQALAVKALRRGEISVGRFAEYLNITRQDAMQFVEQEVPDGEEVQVTAA
jgi:XRE family transcriptional regulator, fatty acid utilization regulator